jgi:DNA phosphorothioation-dependent restriction protein DptG
MKGGSSDRIKTTIKKEGMDCGCKKVVHHKKSMILEICIEERGTRGKVLGMGEKRCTMS